MPIAKRGQSYLVTVNYKKERFRRQFSTEIEAKAWEAQTKLDLTKGITPSANTDISSPSYRPHTFGELARYILKHRYEGTKSYKSTRINMDHMVRLLGEETRLPAITSHDINLAVQALKAAGYPEVTINKKLSPARVAFTYATKQGWMDRVPDMPFYKTGEARLRWYTEDEEARMLRWCRENLDDDLHDYIVVSIDTGIRQGEALTLKARNLYDGRLTLWGARTARDNGTKAGNTRVIPLTPRSRKILENRAEASPDQIFPFTKDQLGDRWNKMRAALGAADDPEFVCHVLRHTFCTRLVRNRVNLAVIQKLAGHLRIETTLRYTKVDDDVLIEAIASLAERKPLQDQFYAGATPNQHEASRDDVACHTSNVAVSIPAFVPYNPLTTLANFG